MYNSKYQGFTPPSRPNVHAESDTGSIKLYWDDIAEISTDVLTGYSDFEGYKIYKSIDGGENWGEASKRIYNTEGLFVGWIPINNMICLQLKILSIVFIQIIIIVKKP